jgi:hypothetical protein
MRMGRGVDLGPAFGLRHEGGVKFDRATFVVSTGAQNMSRRHRRCNFKSNLSNHVGLPDDVAESSLNTI